ncbi:hypothetical protein TSOC_006517 [Tetrabaena socialis]|uniref:Uncharacterized protein n=1 Tax=Tetrabaena socialis TaxID=47790 RepID=A0A2J8A3I1_9CHLO|nr:hypothetical protein TSOC_006517 [Tetrabaena socialis]|eukprot:PNH07063.1 hypothetical protein TSOC_006517 [Tetrabaena socialis]
MEFSIEAWDREDRVRGSQQHVPVSLPEQAFCWTRQPTSEGGQYLYGEAVGLRTYVDPTPLLPYDLNDGYPAAYIRKPDPDDAVPVDVIVYGAALSGLEAAGTSVVTFRNNLNKLVGTLLQPADPWVIEGALLLPPEEEGGGGGEGTLYLEIVKQPERGGGAGDQNDRFTYYG